MQLQTTKQQLQLQQQQQQQQQLPPINQQNFNYVHLLRDKKGQFNFPSQNNNNNNSQISQNRYNQSSILAASSILQNNNNTYSMRRSSNNMKNSTVDDSVIDDFNLILGQIKEVKPSISIYKEVLRSQNHSEKLLKTIEKEFSHPLPKMNAKHHNPQHQHTQHLNQSAIQQPQKPKKIVFNKKVEIVKKENPCKPLFKKFLKRNTSEAIMQNDGFQLDDLRFDKSQKSVNELKTIMSYYVTNNRKYFNKEVIKIPEYEKSAPFYVDSLKFADAFLKGVKQVPKEFGFTEENLYRNNLVLEKVILERLLQKQQDYYKKDQVQSFLNSQSRIIQEEEDNQYNKSQEVTKSQFYNTQNNNNNNSNYQQFQNDYIQNQNDQINNKQYADTNGQQQISQKTN